MDVFDAIRGRRSIRSFTGEDVSDDELLSVVEAARRAPSAGNLQAWSVVAVQDPLLRRELARSSLGQSHVAEAPVDLVFFADEERSAARYGERGRTLYSVQDTAIAATHAMLAAHGLGLGTCWVGAIREQEVRELLNVPEEHRPVAILPLGHPAEEPVKTSRRPLTEILHRDTW